MKKLTLILFAGIAVSVAVLGLTVIYVADKIPAAVTPEIVQNNIQWNLLTDDYISENQHKIDVEHYILSFDLFPEDKRIIATAELQGKVLEDNITSIDLNFYDNFKIKDIELNNENIEYVNVGSRLSIPYQHSENNSFNIKITYEGTPEKAGYTGFVFGKRNDISLVYTLSEPTYASSWFPCNDIPDDKSLLDIYITNDSDNVSVSNGILKGIEINGNRKTYHWKTSYPISTYLIALYSSEYVSFTDKYVSLNKKDTMEIQVYVLPDKLEGAKIDFQEQGKMIKYFSDTFGEYPFIKEKYGVAEFLWQIGAMEHQTITGFASNLISGDKLYTDVIVHELAHQWWGDAIGPKSWKDIWLNEGFSSYSEALYYEHRSGKSALISTMLGKKDDYFPGKLSDPGKFLFTRTVYDKGAWILHMLRSVTGDSLFFKSLREYYNTYKYLNASTNDFINICESVAGMNLDYFFHQWLDNEGEIKLVYDYNTVKEKNKYKTIVDVEQVQDEFDEYHFPLEILIETENKKMLKRFEINERRCSIEIVTDQMPVNFIPDPDSWLLASIKKK